MRISDWSSDVCSSDLIRGFERLAAGEADILQQLRHRVELVQQFAGGFFRYDHFGEQLQRRERAVAGRRMIRQDHVPRLLAADVEPALAHPFEDVAVADLGAFEPQPLARSEEHTSELPSIMRISYAV